MFFLSLNFLYFFSSFIQNSNDSLNDFNSVGIILRIESSLTVDSCFRLSIKGLANDAFIGVTKSTQYEDNLGVKKGDY